MSDLREVGSDEVKRVLAFVDPRPTEQQKAVIARLESWLEMAKKGELLSVAAAFTRPGGWVGEGWTESENLTLLLGAVSVLQGRIQAALLTDDGS